MCLAVVALDSHHRYALVVAANRDEFHARPTAPAAWWDDGLLAGRDLEAGGTWLGVTRAGRFALLTNVREPHRTDRSAPSRGTLVPGVLRDAAPVPDALARARAGGARHNGFNLLAGEARAAAWTSNRGDGVVSLPPGVHGLSNALLDAPWPKVVRTEAAVAAWLDAGQDDPEPLFAALSDRRTAADAELPSTGVPLEWERLLSAPFIVSERYGTRSSTVLTIDRSGHARFVERSFDPAGRPCGEVEHRFDVDASAPPGLA
jgi:uncharacterized protein with NRDE domain